VRYTSPYSPPFSSPLFSSSPFSLNVDKLYDIAARCSRPATSLSSHLTHLCKRSRMHAVGHGRKADRAKCRRPKTAAWPQCCMVAYGWHCDMIGIPAFRHSDTEPIKRTNRRIFIYRLLTVLYDVVQDIVGYFLK